MNNLPQLARTVNFFLLVRSNHNRMLEEGIKLWEYIDAQPVIGAYKTMVSTQKQRSAGKSKGSNYRSKDWQNKLKETPKEKCFHATRFGCFNNYRSKRSANSQ